MASSVFEERINTGQNVSWALSENDANDPIEIVDADSEWSSKFLRESSRIELVMRSLHPQFVHIGSTAVPGLCAKPIVDMLVGVKELDEGKMIGALESLGYVYQPDPGEPERLFFRSWPGREFHIHVVKLHGWTFWKHILFRDYIISHDELCKAYAELKRDSARRFRFNRNAYTDSKSAFIESTVKAATMEAFITIDGQ